MKVRHRLFLVVLATLIIGCGGGNGGGGNGGGGTDTPTTTLTGIAAAVAPLAGASISLACGVDVLEDVTTTNALGAWQAEIPTASLPCLVRAEGGTLGPGGAANGDVLYAVGGEAAETVINITPLTTLALGNAARETTAISDLATYYMLAEASPPSALVGATLIEAQSAVVALEAAMTDAGYVWPADTGGVAFDPFTSAYSATAGDAYNDLLVALAEAITAATSSFNTLLTLYVADSTTFPLPADGGSGGIVTPWGPVLTVLDGGNYGTFQTPALQFDQAVNGVVAWGTSQQIWTNTYTSGAGWGSATRLSPISADTDGDVSLRMNANGTMLALWDSPEGYNDRIIWGSQHTLAGGWTTPVKLSMGTSGTSNTIHRISTAYFASGNALVAWGQNDIYGYEIWNCVFSETTGCNGGVATKFDTSVESPSLASDSAGNMVFAWTKREYGGSIMARYFSPVSGWSTSYTIQPYISGGQEMNPVVRICRDGEGSIDWLESLYGGAGDTYYSLGFVFDFGSFITADSAGTLGSAGSICLDAQGNDFSVWAEKDLLHNTTAIWASTVSGFQYVWTSPEKISSDSPQYGYPRGPAVASDAAGNAFAVWFEYDGTDNRLAYSRFTPDTGWTAPESVPDSGYPDTFSLATDQATSSMVLVWVNGGRIFSRAYSM